jgi:hypothetical protein
MVAVSLIGYIESQAEQRDIPPAQPHAIRAPLVSASDTIHYGTIPSRNYANQCLGKCFAHGNSGQVEEKGKQSRTPLSA